VSRLTQFGNIPAIVAEIYSELNMGYTTELKKEHRKSGNAKALIFFGVELSEHWRREVSAFRVPTIRANQLSVEQCKIWGWNWFSLSRRNIKFYLCLSLGIAKRK